MSGETFSVSHARYRRAERKPIRDQVAEYLGSRLHFLLRAQNRDGGWGYFPGKRSWLEPTVYAMLALQSTGSGPALERAWRWVCGLQTEDGGWRPSAEVGGATWVSALALTLCCARGVNGERTERTLAWLIATAGAESSLAMRAASWLHVLRTRADVSHKGWPWRPGTASWVEPTAQTLIALKKIPRQYRSAAVAYRIKEGEQMILGRRDADGGWNSGNPNVLNTDLPSYPETTAVALLGLQGRASGDAVGMLQRFGAESRSSLANAWIEIALRCYGQAGGGGEKALSPDILLTAIEALGHPDGNYGLLRV